MSKCKITGCTTNAKHRGWCDKHYRRWLRYGDPAIALIQRYPSNAVCQHQGCKRTDIEGHGYCHNHYYIILEQINRKKGKICSVQGCKKGTDTKGFCRAHYAVYRANWRKAYYEKLELAALGKPLYDKELEIVFNRATFRTLTKEIK